MYQKEIIYMGLHKDGSRLGSAGFLKVENRDGKSSLYLKIKNIPHAINGRFPVRFYNGTGWKEVDGITLQEGSGLWEECEPEFIKQVRLQIILPGGYLIEGIGKDAQSLNNESGENVSVSKRKSEPVEGAGITRSRNSVDEISADRDSVDRETGNRGAMDKGAVNREAGNREDVDESAVRWDVQSREDVDEGAVRRDVQSREGVDEGAVRGDVQNRESVDESAARWDAQGRDVINGEVKNQNDRSADTRGVIQSSPVERIPVQRQRRSVQETVAETPAMVSEELPPPMADGMQVEGVKEDKWEQILDTYDQIHPYGDERVYVKLEPKDFVILQAKYQHLVNNSFLLHGFYNYRYVILGKENDYYLGVPGVFYEREKMVALMFGFEAFECQGGEARPGEFGYYLRRVEL